tara:strand:+ start:2106 stop:2711 length:606 start_codon:yes stop_codon:yes gene_type:complete
MYLVILAVAVIVLVVVLTRRNACERIIETSKKYEFMDGPEHVDDKPMGEIALYEDGRPLNVELWDMCKGYYEPLASKHKLVLTYAFLRKYDTGARNDLIMHLDDEEDATTTINVLLSDVKDFEGGELYIFNEDRTRRILDEHGGDMDIPQREKFLKACPNLPVVSLKRGDAVYYEGCRSLHGVTPVTSGERYVLGFFSKFL